MKISDGSTTTRSSSTPNPTSTSKKSSGSTGSSGSTPAARPERDEFRPPTTTTQAKKNATASAGVNGASPVQATSTGATDAAIATQVKKEVQVASNNGADAAQLMTLAHTRSVELVRQNYPNAPPTERMDRAMAIASYVLNGPDQISNLSQVDSGKTKTVQYMRDIQANDPKGEAFAGMGLDHTNGGGTLYDAYNDGTNNQAFHTNFFVAAGYVAGGDVGMALKAQAANIYHETLDGDALLGAGGSVADFGASNTGIIAGGQLFQARNYAAEFEAGQHPSGGNMDLLQPVMVSAFVSDNGTPTPQVQGMNAAQQQAAQQTTTDIQNLRGNPIYQFATQVNPWALPILFLQIPDILNGSKPDIR